MTVTSVDTDLDTLTLTLIADFTAPIEQVWQLWADPRQLERWWGPPTYPATFTRHDLSPGSRFPAALLRALGRARDEELVRNVGVQWATEQVRDLLDHKIRGVHLYTLNHSDAGRKICANLGLLSYDDLG